MKRTLSVTVRGKHRTWAFNFEGDPKYLDEWRADGLEVVEIAGSIPFWAVQAGLSRPWFAWQRFWRWLRLWCTAQYTSWHMRRGRAKSPGTTQG